MTSRIFNWMKGSVLRFLDANCSKYAAGLTYFAMLSIVPVLCCILVAAKACQVDHYAKDEINRRIDAMITDFREGQNDTLLENLPGFSKEDQVQKQAAAEEFAAQARQISDGLFSQIEKFDVSTLGWIGFGFLLWTVISSLASVEDSFNRIFSVEKARAIWKRAYMYLFIMVILPVLVAVAMSVPVLNIAKNIIVATLGANWLTKWAGDGLIYLLDSWLFRFSITFAFSSITFAFFYWVIPNCRVKLRHSLYGGMITALVFGAWMKLCAVAQVGIAKSSALYGSFAFLPIVLAWLYMSWQIVLAGACMVRQFEISAAQKAS